MDWLVWNILLKNVLLCNFSVHFAFCSKNDRKIVQNICFHNSSLNFYIVHESICKYVINCSSSVSRFGLFMVGIIPNRNIRLEKLWTPLFLSKSKRFMLKSPISITSFLGVSFLDKMLFMFFKQCCITNRWSVVQFEY